MAMYAPQRSALTPLLRGQIQEGLKNDLTKFQFEGKEITLDPRTGIFITMNPGYAGRTELPDNLKALFRPVTMIVPDLEQICEIMLFSEGFDMAKVRSPQQAGACRQAVTPCTHVFVLMYLYTPSGNSIVPGVEATYIQL
jgi:hypothetical protein